MWWVITCWCPQWRGQVAQLELLPCHVVTSLQRIWKLALIHEIWILSISEWGIWSLYFEKILALLYISTMFYFVRIADNIFWDIVTLGVSQIPSLYCWSLGMPSLPSPQGISSQTFRHRNSHYKPETVWGPSRFYNGNPYTNKTVSAEWSLMWWWSLMCL